jgi:DNA-binding transcriptional LysR family regulator
VPLNHLRDIALFVEVAREKNFAKAAGKLAMPPSSLSRRIAALEASIGLKLLVRSTRRVELTDAGALYLARCESVVEAAQEAHEQVRGVVQNPQGLLRISAEPETGPLLLGPLIARYLESYPDLRVELDLSPRRVDLLGENFDLAVRLGRLPDSELTVRRLATLRSGIYASPAYIDRYGAPPHPKTLVDHRRLALLHEGDDGEWVLSRGDERIEVRSPPVVATNNMPMLRQFAEAGVGIALLDELMGARAVESGALLRLLTDWNLPGVPISLLTPTRFLSAKTRLFIEMLTRDVSGVVGLSP